MSTVVKDKKIDAKRTIAEIHETVFWDEFRALIPGKNKVYEVKGIPYRGLRSLNSLPISPLPYQMMRLSMMKTACGLSVKPLPELTWV